MPAWDEEFSIFLSAPRGVVSFVQSGMSMERDIGECAPQEKNNVEA